MRSHTAALGRRREGQPRSGSAGAEPAAPRAWSSRRAVEPWRPTPEQRGGTEAAGSGSDGEEAEPQVNTCDLRLDVPG